MVKGFAFGVAALGIGALGIGPQGIGPLGIGTAEAAAVPYTLKGTWLCTFPNGETATIMARAGKSGVSYQRNDGEVFKVFIANTNDGGISAHGDGWAWSLTPKGDGAELVVDAKAKGEVYTAACASK
ncbi:hypothetical protein [Dongia sp.]|uniref:hypothetical protein n=1 Tax=Dongia sp. TaxID=1977262 RepID=UPI003753E74E